jgi:beta-hydroxylase
MIERVLAPHVLVLLALAAAYVACALYVHFRGKERHAWPRQLTDHSTFLAPYNVLIYAFSAVPRKPILDLDGFPDLARLRENWRTIRDEAEALYEAGHIQPSEKFHDVAFNSFFKRGWKRFYLKWYGDVLPSAQTLCPKTVALVQSIPSVNAALFALLPPHSRLGKHRDPFAGSLRYHLGLVTPNRDECRIYVDGTPYSWRDGEAVLFDETYIHNARNDTDEARIILFCDVARPIRGVVVRAINRFMTRRVMRFTAARNVDTERIGFVSRLAGAPHRTKEALLRFKKRRRRLYYAIKYVVMLVLLGGVAFGVWKLFG